MGAFTIIPAPIGINNYVEYFWETEWDSFSNNQFDYLSRASVAVKIIFAFDDDDYGNVTPLFTSIHGQNEDHNWYPVPYEKRFKIFGIRLYPHALPPLFNIGITDLKEQMFSLDNIINGRNSHWFQQISIAKNLQDRIQLFSAFIQSCLNITSIQDMFSIPVLTQISNAASDFRIINMAKDVGLSEKQFERKFKAVTGFNPKRFASIARFEQAVNSYGRQKSLTDIAYENGYYDQAHFIRNFKKYTGITPNQYFKLGFL